MISLVGVFILGVLAGCAWEQRRRRRGVIERWRDVDERECERWKAYCALLGAGPARYREGEKGCP